MGDNRVRALVHELHVQRMELEIQKEELRRVSAELEQSRNQFSLLFHQAPIGYLVLNEIGLIYEVNETFCRMVERARSRLLGNSFADCLERNSRDPFLGRYPGFFRKPAGKSLEAMVRRERGAAFYAHLEGTTIRTALGSRPVDGTPLLLLAVTDISERKWAEEKRLQLERQMQQTQRLESLGVLAGGIAHDFNNLLAIILGNANLAMEELPADSPARDSLHAIESTSLRAAELCRQMLAYSGKGWFAIETMDLNALIDEMVALLKASIAKKTTLNLALDADLPALRGDPSQIRQVVMNLVINAAEAIGDEGGVVTISTGALKCTHEELSDAYLNETLNGGLYAWLVPVLVTLAGVFGVAYSLRFAHGVFFGAETGQLPQSPHEAPRWMRLPIELLVALCLAVGMLPGWTVLELLQVASRSVVGDDLPPINLALWHGVNLPLLMSLAAMLLGLVLYRWPAQLAWPMGRLVAEEGGKRSFDALQACLLQLARTCSAVWHRDSLRRGLLRWLLVCLLAGIWPWFGQLSLSALPLAPLQRADIPPLVGGGIMLLAALVCVRWHQQRVLAVLAAGVVGLMTALTFVLYSSPDLALTQLVVEVVATILLLLALRHLPEPRHGLRESRLRRGRDALLALLAGGGISILLYMVLTHPVESLSGYYLQHSLPLGGGSNVVNVILVDFRGFDTFGEITVLGLAGLLLIKLLQQGSTSHAEIPTAPMLRLGVRLLLPFGLLVAVYLFLRGHQQPGGGFVAGLVTVVFLVLPVLAGMRGSRLAPPRWMAMGLAVALMTGCGAWWFDSEFLSSAHGHLQLPLLGELEWATAALFDLAVYLLVVGAGWALFTRLAQYQPEEGA
jgi:PAS domain S-box-containing protein